MRVFGMIYTDSVDGLLAAFEDVSRMEHEIAKKKREIINRIVAETEKVGLATQSRRLEGNHRSCAVTMPAAVWNQTVLKKIHAQKPTLFSIVTLRPLLREVAKLSAESQLRVEIEAARMEPFQGPSVKLLS